jgi:MFS family permease
MPHFGMAVICFILFLTFLDNTVISATLSDVQSGLHAGVAQLQWVVSGYALAFASLMLMAGTLGDLYGRKKLMLIGVVIFCAGSVAERPGRSTMTLIAGRVVMGIGAACSEPGTLSMIRHLYPERRAGPGPSAIWAAVSGLALAMGPVIGGVLVGIWDWRAVFWFNLIFGAWPWWPRPSSCPRTRTRSGPAWTPRLRPRGVALGTPPSPPSPGRPPATSTPRSCPLRGGRLALVVFVLVEPGPRTPCSTCASSRSRRSPARRSWPSPPTSGSSPSSSSWPSTSRWWATVSPFHLALGLHPHDGGHGAGLAVHRPVGVVVGPRVPMTVGCLLAAAGIFCTNALITPNAGISTVGWTLAWPASASAWSSCR